MSREPDDATELRCDGLLFSRRRPLEPEERQTILAESRRHRRRAWLCLLGIPFGFVLLFGLAFLLPRTDATALTIGILGFVFFLLGGSVFTSLALDRFRWSRGLRRDLARNTMLIFEDESPEGSADDKRRRIEVLAASSLFWRIDGERPSSWTTAFLARTGRTPDRAAVAARWVRPVAGSSGRVAMLNQRDLSPEEVAELRGRWRRGLPRFAFSALLLIFVVNITAIRLRSPDRDVLAFLMAGFVVFWATWTVREAQGRWRLRRDAAAARVLIVLGPPGPAPDGEPVPGPTIEFLPISKLPWTRNGRPMDWRTRGSIPANRLPPAPGETS